MNTIFANRGQSSNINLAAYTGMIRSTALKPFMAALQELDEHSQTQVCTALCELSADNASEDEAHNENMVVWILD